MPPLILSLLIATFYGCSCHFLVGRQLWQWPLYWTAALVGFFGGFAAAVGLGFEWLRVGSVPVVAATAGSFLMLWLCWFFSAPYVNSAENRPGSV